MFFIFKLNVEEVALRLKQARDDKKLTTAEVAKNTGLSSGNISSWENGKFLPSATALYLLSNQYGITVDWILKGDITAPLPAQKVEAIIDPDLKMMIDVLQNLMLSGDPDLRGWAKVQFKRAFGEQSAAVEEKNNTPNASDGTTN
ncbi:helix-turn-helix domain-containing protein [Thomasclavelia cocleata]|uniref:helix-turn-helix domain-containing protein n=1 Tax=Thomasclavelia cocleata TaxID=69824 RepID=UPI002430288A|nr:helix-turn-helix transcriptional regulator [Thomasclavelia cocleata]